MRSGVASLIALVFLCGTASPFIAVADAKLPKCEYRGSGATALDDLVSRLSAQSCSSLEVSRKPIGPTLTQHLTPGVLASGSTLKEIEFKGTNLGDAGAQTLVEWAPALGNLLELELASNGIGDSGAKALAEAFPSMSALQDLDLGANTISADGAAAVILAAKSSLPSLEELDLAFNLINDSIVAAVEELFAPPIQHRIQRLKLSGNLLSPEAVRQLHQITHDAAVAGTFVKISVKQQRNVQRDGPVMPSPVMSKKQKQPYVTPGATRTAPSVASASQPPPVISPVDDLPFTDWSEEDVGAWLRSTSSALAQYADKFSANAIDGSLLATLKDSDLKALNIDNDFHRARILKELAKLKAGRSI